MLGGSPSTALVNATSITAGWTGTLSGTRGGTGVANTGKTITLGGNFTTSGAFDLTGTLTGATSVTFPTSGTLATTSQLVTPAALTKTDDTNVTLTLGGTPTTALVNAASITAGWTGTLSGTRGGTGVANTGKTITLGGNFTTSGAFDLTGTLTGATSVTFPTSGTLATTSQLVTPAALTKTDDTNITLTLGGSPSTALVNATSITAGWTGQLATSRGGTGTGTAFTQNSVVFAGASGVYSQDNTNFNYNSGTQILTALNLNGSGTTASTSSSTGTIKTAGGIGISNTTDASSSTNGGTITTAGGAAIAKKLYIGTQVTISGLAYARINGMGAQIIPNAISPEVQLSGTYWDQAPATNGPMSISAGVITCTDAGYYQVSASVVFSSNDIGYRGVYISLNASTSPTGRIAYSNLSPVDGDRTGITISACLSVGAGNTLRVYVYQTSGGDLSMDTIVNGQFSAVRLG